MAAPGRGFNIVHGYDTGPPPPSFSQPSAQYPGFPGFPGFPPPAYGQAPLPYPTPIAPTYPQYPGYPPMPGTYPQGMYPGMFPGAPGTHPAAAPRGDGGIPGVHLRNHTGGVGLPPGYNYIFPQEHCKVHVFKTKEKPWHCTIWKEDSSTHVKLFIPASTSVKELMQNIGCTNPEASKNILYEVTEKGNGRWAHGIVIKGDEKDKVKKCIKDFGWDKSRTGHPGERGVVWLWVTKDGA